MKATRYEASSLLGEMEKRRGDVFIVTSCLNPADNAAYPNHNSAHTLEERFSELLETFSSIRKFYPSSIIINVDNSRVPASMQEELCGAVDVSLNYADLLLMRWARKSRNKGVPYALSAALGVRWYSRKASSQIGRLHILAGRYILTGRALASVQERGAHFLYYDEHRNVSTRYFAYVSDAPWRLIWALVAGIPFMAILGRSVEGTIIRFPLLRWSRVERLDLYGWVNGTHEISE